MYDVLSYMLPAQWFTDDKHLSSSAHPVFGLRKDDWLWYIKGRSGFPWDGNYFDDKHIYHSITEGPKGWQDPTSYKIFRSKSWNSRGGIAWSPRYIDPMQATSDNLVTDDSTYETYENGKLINTQNLGGKIVCNLRGPHNIIVGKLGLQNVVVQSYQWDTGLKHMEINTYALNLGWVKWELYELKSGTYAQVQETLFDRVDNSGTPELIFPNKLPC
jgi:hypothetical protein